jgi:hypothetical protein
MYGFIHDITSRRYRFNRNNYLSTSTKKTTAPSNSNQLSQVSVNNPEEQLKMAEQSILELRSQLAEQAHLAEEARIQMKVYIPTLISIKPAMKSTQTNIHKKKEAQILVEPVKKPSSNLVRIK